MSIAACDIEPTTEPHTTRLLRQIRNLGDKDDPKLSPKCQLIKAKHLWQHDAFFDYCDRWMSPDDSYAAQRGRFLRPRDEGRTFDPFVDAMWAAYRQAVPPQEEATRSLKWVWKSDNQGDFVPNSIDGDK